MQMSRAVSNNKHAHIGRAYCIATACFSHNDSITEWCSRTVVQLQLCLSDGTAEPTAHHYKHNQVKL